MEEMNRRLDNLPPDLDELYATIFRRMDIQDLCEAQVMFQLVCFARGRYGRNAVNVRQLREAVAVAKGNSCDVTQEHQAASLDRFRKRMKAKSGGLLEEVVKADEQADANANGDMVKLIHRTAESFLRREGWLSDLRIKEHAFNSPHALWLYVCCKQLQNMMKPYNTQMWIMGSNGLKLHESPKSSLLEYAPESLFVHARIVEEKFHESSYSYLKLVFPPLWRCLFEQYRETSIYEHFHVDFDAWDHRESQPWRIVVEQGLALCCRDVLRRDLFVPNKNGEDVSVALSYVGEWYETEDFPNGQPIHRLISVLINSGVAVNERNIIECLCGGTAAILETLLQSWPKENLRLRRDVLYLPEGLRRYGERDELDQKYAGETVGPLWELARGGILGSEFGTMLDFLLERGELLDEICGPGGTMMHALIIGIVFSWSWNVVPRLKLLLHRRANPNATGPRGTPLQLAWRTFHSYSWARTNSQGFRR